MKLYLGIDGGGTQTRSLLIDPSGNILGHGNSGPSNPHSVPAEKMSANLCKSVKQALTEAGAQASDIYSACIGIAGGSSTDAKRAIQVALRPLDLEDHITLEFSTDAEIALYGAHLGRPGMIIISGTGSVCFGKTAKGNIYRSGGLGPHSKDGGSAEWIRQRAIESADTDSPLGRLIQEHSEGAAGVCPALFSLAESDDKDALQVVEAAAEELLKLIKETSRLCGPECTHLALLGGTLYSNTILNLRLRERLGEDLPRIQVIPAVLTPVAGAALKASMNITQDLQEALIRNLHAQQLSRATHVHHQNPSRKPPRQK